MALGKIKAVWSKISFRAHFVKLLQVWSVRLILCSEIGVVPPSLGNVWRSDISSRTQFSCCETETKEWEGRNNLASNFVLQSLTFLTKPCPASVWVFSCEHSEKNCNCPFSIFRVAYFFNIFPWHFQLLHLGGNTTLHAAVLYNFWGQTRLIWAVFLPIGNIRIIKHHWALEV